MDCFATFAKSALQIRIYYLSCAETILHGHLCQDESIYFLIKHEQLSNTIVIRQH